MKIQFNGSGAGRYQAFCLPGGTKLVTGASLDVGPELPEWFLGVSKKHRPRFAIDGIRADKWLAKNLPPPKSKPKSEAK